MLNTSTLAPPLRVAQWFNTDAPITLNALRGRVVVVHAFQMLCPGCVSHGLPQAKRVQQLFPTSDVVVLGLHAVFEHHDAMGANALKVFLHEYRIAFPVAVDLPNAHSPIPATMQAYRLRGTPSLIVIDRHGVVRLNHFGHMEDLQLGALIGELVAGTVTETPTGVDKLGTPTEMAAAVDQTHCDDRQCTIHDDRARE